MSEPNAGTTSKAPWHLWAIGILGLLWSAVGATDYFMAQTHNDAYMKAFTTEQLAFYYGLPAWVVACWAVGVWGGVAGCLLLLLRKRIAVPVLLASIVGAVLTFTHNLLLSNGIEVMGGGASAVLLPLFIVLISVGLWWYARLMQRKGVIR